jgi:hypothetical protein
MRDYLSLDPTPYEEPCIQVGHELYRSIGSMEAHLMKDQLRELLLTKYSDILVNIAITQCPHDYGSYYQIYVYFDEESAEQAYWLDDNFPAYWSTGRFLLLSDYCKKKGFTYS